MLSRLQHALLDSSRKSHRIIAIRGIQSFPSMTTQSLPAAGMNSAKSTSSSTTLAVVALAAATSATITFTSQDNNYNNFSLLSTPVTECHCQVPCGIFDDPTRISTLKEHASTIRKAMVQITALATSPDSNDVATVQNFHQATRWISVKEEAASDIITIVSEYMLCQRVKKELFANQRAYYEALEIHHELMQSAMKAKQSVDVAACEKLEKCIDKLSKIYTK